MKKLFSNLLSLYIVIGVIFIPLFNYQYVKTHGFASWLLFGEIVPTLQATIWPVTLIGDMNQTPASANKTHFNNSIRYHNTATGTLNSIGANKSNYADFKPLFEQLGQTYVEAQNVDMAWLRSSYPELATHYETEFIPSVELMLRYKDGGTNDEFLKGQILSDKFADWYHTHLDEIGRKLN